MSDVKQLAARDFEDILQVSCSYIEQDSASHIASAVYHTCYRESTPRTPQQSSSGCDIRTTDMARTGEATDSY